MQEGLTSRFSLLVTTAEEFDRVAADFLPELLDCATAQTRRFLRGIGQWENDVAHEKLALRWGYELVERFLVCGRSEIPCRPFFLFDSLIAKFFSQPKPLCPHPDVFSPLGRFLDGLISRSVVSRNALMALFYHVYGFGQGHVVRLLGLGPAESQRIYKNFERWRESGWQRTVEEIGLTETDLGQIEARQGRSPLQVNAEVGRLLGPIFMHYRKSEPQHFPCRTREKWAELFDQDYGHDYRVWHLALCLDCLVEVHALRQDGLGDVPVPRVDLQVRPLMKGRSLTLIVGDKGDEHGTRTGRMPRLSRAPA